MDKRNSIKLAAQLLIDGNNGAMMMNFKAVARALGCHTNTVAPWLNRRGVLVSTIGPKKLVSAIDLADAMYKERTSPIVRRTVNTAARGWAGGA
jgi:hypothetical protein